MTNIDEKSKWEEDVYLISEKDEVKGGVSGTANIQAKQLANRTQWLRNMIAGVMSADRPYQNEAEAQHDIDVGKIPPDAIFNVRSESDMAWVDEYRNHNGVAEKTGKSSPTLSALESLLGELQSLEESGRLLFPMARDDYTFAIVDAANRAAIAIDEHAVVEIFNLLISTGKVRLKNGGVLADVVNTIFDSGDAAFAITDPDNTYALKIGFDGSTHIARLSISSPSEMKFDNGRTLQDYVNKEISITNTAFAITDENGKSAIAIKNDGTVDVYKLSLNDKKTFLPDGRTLYDALLQGGDRTKDRFDTQITSGALYVRDLNTQKRYLIKDSGVTSAEIEGEHVVFKVGSDDFYAALPDGKVFKRFPSMRLSCIGDSLTNGYINGVDTDAYPFKLGALLNIPVEKRGWSGRASGDIALRMGATVVKLTVIGNTIPASGAVVVTLVDPATGYRSGMLDNYPEGTLAGVTGTLSRSESNVWTFTRKTAGSAVPCPPGSEYLHNGYPTANDGMVITWMGRNNYESMFAEVMRDQQQFTQWITTLNKQQIVIGITNTANEPRGSANYDAILRVNSELAAAYPGRYFDAMRYLIDHGLSDAGITPTAQDLTDISKDIIPSSLRIDNTHFNAVGYQLIANQLYQLIQQLGWK